MNFNFETHCHSFYSHDSRMRIEEIIKKCKEHEINGIVVCDHDRYGITKEDEQAFADNNIRLFKAIEFTAREDVHIIGISDNIKKLEAPPKQYPVIDLADKINGIEGGGVIIIPHPEAPVGLFNRHKVSRKNRDYVLRNAHFIEEDNWHSGHAKTVNDVLKRYSNLTRLWASDSHFPDDVGAYYNSCKTDEPPESLTDIHDKGIICHKRLRKSAEWWAWQQFWMTKRRDKIFRIGKKILPVTIQKWFKKIMMIFIG